MNSAQVVLEVLVNKKAPAANRQLGFTYEVKVTLLLG